MNNLNRFETPTAVRHDLDTLTQDARALLAATAESTDEKVTVARQRLQTAVDTTKAKLSEARECAEASARRAESYVRDSPFYAMALAFGVGAVVGVVLGRR